MTILEFEKRIDLSQLHDEHAYGIRTHTGAESEIKKINFILSWLQKTF